MHLYCAVAFVSPQENANFSALNATWLLMHPRNFIRDTSAPAHSCNYPINQSSVNSAEYQIRNKGQVLQKLFTSKIRSGKRVSL